MKISKKTIASQIQIYALAMGLTFEQAKAQMVNSASVEGKEEFEAVTESDLKG